MPEFTAQIIHIGQLFAHPILVEAPSYQRSFAWSAQQGNQLLEDIATAHEAARARDAGGYFVGTMLFIERGQGMRDGVPSRSMNSIVPTK